MCQHDDVGGVFVIFKGDSVYPPRVYRGPSGGCETKNICETETEKNQECVSVVITCPETDTSPRGIVTMATTL